MTYSIDEAGNIVGDDVQKHLTDCLNRILPQLRPSSSSQRLLCNRKGLINSDIEAICKWVPGSGTRWLSLEFNRFDSSVCSGIGELLKHYDCKLRYLSIESNSIGEGVRHIFEGLVNNHKLVSLNIARCGITDEHLIPCLPLIERSPGICDINFFGNKLSPTIMAQVFKVLGPKRIARSERDSNERIETEKMAKADFDSKERVAIIAAMRAEFELIEKRRIQRLEMLNENWKIDTLNNELKDLEISNQLVQEAEFRKESKKGKKGGKQKKK